MDYFVKDTIIENIPLTFIPKGPYKKGYQCEQDSINYNYWIGIHEITNKQFYTFLKKALQENYIFTEEGILLYPYKGDDMVSPGDYRIKMLDDRIFFKDNSLILNEKYANHPVISVTWYGCKAFCDYYGFDLPSEAEWEKAARGDLCLWFPWGNDIDESYANFHGSFAPDKNGTTPVGYYNGHTQGGFKTSDSRSVYGCYDLAGNAWEWTKDLLVNDLPYRLGKGGGFNIHYPYQMQSYYVSTIGVLEEHIGIETSHLSDGFRIVLKE